MTSPPYQVLAVEPVNAKALYRRCLARVRLDRGAAAAEDLAPLRCAEPLHPQLDRLAREIELALASNAAGTGDDQGTVFESAPSACGESAASAPKGRAQPGGPGGAKGEWFEIAYWPSMGEALGITVPTAAAQDEDGAEDRVEGGADSGADEGTEDGAGNRAEGRVGAEGAGRRPRFRRALVVASDWLLVRVGDVVTVEGGLRLGPGGRQAHGPTDGGTDPARSGTFSFAAAATAIAGEQEKKQAQERGQLQAQEREQMQERMREQEQQQMQEQVRDDGQSGGHSEEEEALASAVALARAAGRPLTLTFHRPLASPVAATCVAAAAGTPEDEARRLDTLMAQVGRWRAGEVGHCFRHQAGAVGRWQGGRVEGLRTTPHGTAGAVGRTRLERTYAHKLHPPVVLPPATPP